MNAFAHILYRARKSSPLLSTVNTHMALRMQKLAEEDLTGKAKSSLAGGSLAGHSPVHGKAAGSIPAQGTGRGVGPTLGWEAGRGQSIDVSLSLKINLKKS